MRRGESGEDRRKHARAASRRRCDDHAHRGIDLLHGKRAGQHVTEGRVRQRPGRARAQLGGISPDQPRRRFQIPDQPLLDGALHDMERPAERVANLGDGTSLIVGLRFQRELRERGCRVRWRPELRRRGSDT